MLRALSLTLFAAVALASCGGGEDTDDAESLLDGAFAGEIRSADLKLEAELDLKGSSAFERPLRLEASGPVIVNEGTLPSADLELQVGSDGGGQTVSTGVLLTGDRAFVKFQDVYYEEPAAEVRRANRLLRRVRGERGTLARLGLDPRDWMAEATDEGEAEVGGVETRHVSGTLDVEGMLLDLGAFVRRSGSALGGASLQTTPEPLSSQQIRTIAASVESASFDLFVGKEDDLVRRLSGRVEIGVPKTSRAGLGGVDSGSMEFSLEFLDVNGDQEVEPPADARPLSALTRSLGVDALGVLSGDDELDGSGQDSAAPDPPTGTTPGAEDFSEYADCLDEARPEDTEALQRCAELLQRP